MIEEAIAGLFLGAVYLRTGKNLAVPILGHGASGTLDKCCCSSRQVSACIIPGSKRITTGQNPLLKKLLELMSWAK